MFIFKVLKQEEVFVITKVQFDQDSVEARKQASKQVSK